MESPDQRLEEQLFDEFIGLHEGLGGDKAMRELRDSGVAINRIRTLYPLELDSYRTDLRCTFSDRKRAMNFLTATRSQKESIEALMLGEGLSQQAWDFIGNDENQMIYGIAHRSLSSADMESLHLSDKDGRKVDSQIFDALYGFAAAMGAAHDWSQYVRNVLHVRPDASHQLAALSKGMPSYMGHLRTHLIPKRVRTIHWSLIRPLN